MGLSARVRAFFDYRRFERRHVHRSKRPRFVSNAQYVDGQYFVNSPDANPDSPTLQHSPLPLSQINSLALPTSPTSPTPSTRPPRPSRPPRPTSLCMSACGDFPTTPMYEFEESPQFSSSRSSPATPGAGSFGSSADRRRSAIVLSSPNDSEFGDIRQEERLRRKRQRMSMIDESRVEPGGGADSSVLGGSSPRPNRGSWVGRRWSMLAGI